MTEFDIEEVFTMIGFGRMQLQIVIVCAILQIYVCNEMVGVSIVYAAARCDLDITAHRMGYLVSAFYIGQILISQYMGYKIDLIGRRKVMLFTTSMSIIVTLLTNLMPNFWFFMIGRCIVGMCVLGPGLCIFTYPSEFVKISHRTKIVNVFNYSLAFSMIFNPFISKFIEPLQYSISITNGYTLKSWRLLLPINAIPGIIGVIWLYFLPESPKFLLAINKFDKAFMVMDKACKLNRGQDLESLGVTSLTQPNLTKFEEPKERNIFLRMWNATAVLYKPPFRRNYILLCGILFCSFATGNAFSIWLPRIMSVASSSEESVILCDMINAINKNQRNVTIKCLIDEKVLNVSMMHGCFIIAGFTILALLNFCVRRIVFCALFTAVSAVCGFCLNFDKNFIQIAILFILHVSLPMIIIRTVASIVVDIMPTHMRAKAVSLSMLFGRFGTIVSSNFLGYAILLNCQVAFNVMVLVSLICCILILLLKLNQLR